ncbi:MAG: IclR family transcriptional regulator C-terminal domain-containing protein [Pseudomonadota bacterium]
MNESVSDTIEKNRKKNGANGSVTPAAGATALDPEGISDRDFINSLARGLEVISAFSRSKPKMTLSDMSRATGMTRATVRRLLLTLVREGYAKTDGRYFSLQPKVLKLGFAVISSMGIWDVAQPIMNTLSGDLQESCFAVVLDGDEVTYVAKADAKRVVNIGINVGSRAPAYAVSSGRVLLAALPDDELQHYLDHSKLEKLTPHTTVSKVKLREEIEEVRARGWSIVDQELEIGLRSISVPVRNPDGDVLAALNVCCPSARISPEEIRTRILADLLTSSREITVALQSS